MDDDRAPMGLGERVRHRLVPLLLVALVTMAASCQTDTGKAQLQQGTYLGLQKAGQVAIQTSEVMNRLCPAGTIPAATCRGWNAFLPHFQFAYDQLATAWITGAKGDLGSLTAATSSLIGEVMIYAYTAGVAPAP